jgi:hypothetical protein
MVLVRCEYRYREDESADAFAPGKIVFVESLQPLHALLQIPLPALIMCVRDKDMRPFHVNLLKKHYTRFSTLQFILHEPWAAHLTAAYTRFIGLTADVLIKDGLTRKHIKSMMWPLSKWAEYFAFENRHMIQLNIKRPEKLFDLTGKCAHIGMINITI